MLLTSSRDFVAKVSDFGLSRTQSFRTNNDKDQEEPNSGHRLSHSSGSRMTATMTSQVRYSRFVELHSCACAPLSHILYVSGFQTGTPVHMAPELMVYSGSTRYSSKVDIFR